MLLRLFLLAVLISPVLSLDCYVCSSSATNDECNQNTQECQAPLDTCMTTIDILGATTAIVKQCASLATCTGASSSATVDSNGNGNIVNCCNSFNLCNFSGAESIHIHSVLLLLTAGVLFLLSR
ncbi:prostate stem cell antigen-like [Xyrichtys novacula]|uniref:Prostate stem cell antigen-like n=1 Tax=Xyrichtys novacula TaxID=13765 RepID=A0AAV1FJU4_XYRNO|nr:prostate stem cell antigen-like [Xyrichtys novacula]